MNADQIPIDLAIGLTNSCIEVAIAEGKLDPRDKSREQFVRDVIAYLTPAANGTIPFAFSDDHRPALLRQARQFNKAGRVEEAVLYYATWIEHMLNVLTASAFRRQKHPEDITRVFIRDTGISAKYIFILDHFCKKAPAQSRLKTLSTVAQRRNQFVHFKWTYYAEQEWEKQTSEYQRAARDAESLVTHLLYLEKRYLQHGVATRIAKA